MANIAWFEIKKAVVWISFGIRGPGGSRTGSVVAVAMSPLPQVCFSGFYDSGLTVSIRKTNHATCISVIKMSYRPVGGGNTNSWSRCQRRRSTRSWGWCSPNSARIRTRAQLEVAPKLLQPMGIVHGGVYCSMIESLASVGRHTWMAANGGGTVVGVNNNTDFLRAISSGTVYGDCDADTSRPPSATVAGHHHRRRRPAGRPGPGAAAESGEARRSLAGGFRRLALCASAAITASCFNSRSGERLLLGNRQLAAVAAQERHRPGQQRGDLGLEADQVDEVQHQPGQPRR